MTLVKVLVTLVKVLETLVKVLVTLLLNTFQSFTVQQCNRNNKNKCRTIFLYAIDCKKLMGNQTQKNIASNDCNYLAPLVNVKYQI